MSGKMGTKILTRTGTTNGNLLQKDVTEFVEPISLQHSDNISNIYPLDKQIRGINKQANNNTLTSFEEMRETSIGSSDNKSTENEQMPLVKEDVFSKENIDFSYDDNLIINATKVVSVCDYEHLLEYIYAKEEEVCATLLVSAYGVSDHVFEKSESHEIVTLGGEKYFSNKEKTLDESKLNSLLSSIAKALATTGTYDLPLVQMHTFTNTDGETYSIKALVINTFKYNVILGLCDKFHIVTTKIFECNNEFIIRFEKK